MLKALIQLFAEKFLVSRSDWISYQSNPTVQATHITPSATGEWVSIVSPCNGWFCVKGVASQVLLSNGEVWQGCHTTEASYKGLWPTYYRQTPRAHTSSLLRVLVINNLQTGGALC